MRAVLLYLMFISAAHAATLVVTVRFVRNDRGHVRVAVCPRTMFLQPHCPWFANSPAHAGDVQVVIRNLPPGTYAAEAFHDWTAAFSACPRRAWVFPTMRGCISGRRNSTRRRLP
jgi:uncharacterized protein (DUF2141 family)